MSSSNLSAADEARLSATAMAWLGGGIGVAYINIRRTAALTI